MELHCCNIGVQQKTSVMLRPSVLPERGSKSIMKGTAKTLVPAGPACDESVGRGRGRRRAAQLRRSRAGMAPRSGAKEGSLQAQITVPE